MINTERNSKFKSVTDCYRTLSNVVKREIWRERKNTCVLDRWSCVYFGLIICVGNDVKLEMRVKV